MSLAVLGAVWQLIHVFPRFGEIRFCALHERQHQVAKAAAALPLGTLVPQYTRAIEYFISPGAQHIRGNYTLHTERCLFIVLCHTVPAMDSLCLIMISNTSQSAKTFKRIKHNLKACHHQRYQANSRNLVIYSCHHCSSCL